MATATFQRARKPEEIIQRRETLLAAAAELFDGEGPQGAGLTAIAARAGFTKSNVYRYFESREDVLLQLFLREMAQMVEALETGLARIGEGDIDAIAELVAAQFAGRSRLGHLTSIVSTTLEANVSEDRIVATKREMGGLSGRIAAALSARLPGTTLDDCVWVVTMLGGLVAGIWPGANPAAPAAAQVLSRPEFAPLRPDIERDLKRAARALLASICPAG